MKQARYLGRAASRGKLCLEDERISGGDLPEPTAVIWNSNISEISRRTLRHVQLTVVEGMLARGIPGQCSVTVGEERGSDGPLQRPPCGFAGAGIRVSESSKEIVERKPPG